jgi:hypothetical protein
VEELENSRKTGALEAEPVPMTTLERLPGVALRENDSAGEVDISPTTPCHVDETFWGRRGRAIALISPPEELLAIGPTIAADESPTTSRKRMGGIRGAKYIPR